MLEQQLQDLLDKQAITELVHAYANAADRHDHQKMRALYHPDAIDEHGDFFTGPAMDFIDMLPDIQAPMTVLHHNVTTTNIKLEGDYAEGEIYIWAMHQIKTVDNGLSDLIIGGRYFDRYEKREGQWKFLHRAIVADWANTHEKSQIKRDAQTIAGARLGLPGKDDPSYDFFRLFKFGEV